MHTHTHTKKMGTKKLLLVFNSMCVRVNVRVCVNGIMFSILTDNSFTE